jgi:hypothetical protein
VVESAHAVVSIWVAHQVDAALDAIDADRPEAAMVVRSGLDVLVLPLPAGGAAFVGAARRGESLGQAAACAARACPAFDLPSTLGLLLAHGGLTALQLPRRQAS